MWMQHILPIFTGILWCISLCVNLSSTFVSCFCFFKDVRRPKYKKENQSHSSGAKKKNVSSSSSSSAATTTTISKPRYTIVRPVRLAEKDPGILDNILCFINPLQSDPKRQHLIYFSSRNEPVVNNLYSRLGINNNGDDDNDDIENRLPEEDMFLGTQLVVDSSSSSSSISNHNQHHQHIEILFTDQNIDTSKNEKAVKMRQALKKAKGEWVIFADSNVRVPEQFINELDNIIDTAMANNNLVSRPDIISGIPGGIEPSNLFGGIETCIMNTIFARESVIATISGYNPINGKFMMFRRSFVDEKLDDYLKECETSVCEDNVIWNRSVKDKLHVQIICIPVYQYIGNPRFNRVFSRFRRWFIIHRKLNLLFFLIEFIVFMPVVSALLGSITTLSMFPQCQKYEVIWFLCIHTMIYYLMDLCMMSSIDYKTGIGYFWYWVTAQFTLPIIWLASIFSNSVCWRGRKLKIGKNGVLINNKPHQLIAE